MKYNDEWMNGWIWMHMWVERWHSTSPSLRHMAKKPIHLLRYMFIHLSLHPYIHSFIHPFMLLLLRLLLLLLHGGSLLRSAGLFFLAPLLPPIAVCRHPCAISNLHNLLREVRSSCLSFSLSIEVLWWSVAGTGRSETCIARGEGLDSICSWCPR